MPIDFQLPQVPFQVRGILSTVGPLDILDILIVAIILYKVYEMLQDTRAITLVKGLLVLLGITLVCNWMELHVISWLLQKTVTLIFVALPIVFQPELRRALEHLGQGRFLGNAALLDDEQARSVVHELVRAVRTLASTKTGALLVIERNMGLNDISATGIQIDGLITAEFLLNVFIPNTPLHDGAAVIRGNRLIAAGCLLPLTENRTLSTELGTRHRAAIGLSEQCDALIVVVSEETGTISIAENGHIMRHLDKETLQAMLEPAFSSMKPGFRELVENWRKKK
ncbi:MAG: diadenylate cyclase CdaA [Veillonellaceae bacterium]|uniref:diadenylate cyclase CdaA n=1 Tax=uncultured Selenomonas sp. TaxID=159275 RepID=UPI0025E1B19C|nr:diadenylate cyclase CdaA [uncultured Selenomonas sp.]MCI7540792.1 diadenylate cyclase CdaA [Veillonellaceae bacterium]MDD6127574.1 diadenylate cyclase CdaA [Veillonellaceae bacterium]MDD6698189.1 diadenylate cyclase CdaA [Veillonellaceae bacterium]MDY6350864.1 diadenylate cyclase CdaA [Selenomonas sp.]